MLKINIKNFIKKLKLLILENYKIMLILSIPLWFIFSSNLIEPVLEKLIKIDVDPALSGGIIIERINDQVSDDNGDGTYTYPLNENYNYKNICDLVSYEVYRPLIDNSLNEPYAFWQISITMFKIPNIFNYESKLSGINIGIYIDINGTKTGSTKTIYNGGEYISFDQEHPWDIFILIDGKIKDKAKMCIYNEENFVFIPCYIVNEKNKIIIQIPLNTPFLQLVLDGRKTFHYIVSGLSDNGFNNDWLNIKEEASNRYGGGLKWENGPRVYDIFVPENFSQADILGGKYKNEEEKVVLKPIEIKGFNKNIDYLNERKVLKKQLSFYNRDLETTIKKLEKEKEMEEKKESEKITSEFKEKLKSNSDIDKIIGYFGLGEYDKSKDIIEKVLILNPEEPVALAYKGSLIAMEGGKTKNPMQAINYVLEAYKYLDRAVEIINEKLQKEGFNDENIEKAINVYFNRANVSCSVPNQIFNKLEVAISDFNFLVELFNKKGDKKMEAEILLTIALIYERNNQKDKANIYFLRLSNIEEKSAKIKFELFKRGYKY
ncbi:MAG: hypothetical protein N3A58_00345 [Spirochaetes bacterium]|nr:hypothetical protein [Spirochaetota bacterium]